MLLGSGAAHAQKLDVESLARMPDVTGVSMSAEGDFIVAIRADPRDPTKRVIATADISNIATAPAAQLDGDSQRPDELRSAER